MRADRDDTSEDWRTIAYAAGVVAARYGATIDEATRVLDFEASLFGLPLTSVARLALSSPSPDRPTLELPDQDAPEARDRRRATAAADRAARRWVRPPGQGPHARRIHLPTAAVAAVRRSSGVAFADPAGGRRPLVLRGQALSRYLDEGGPTGALGRPLSELRAATPGPDTPLGADQEVAFAHGTIYLDPDGRTKVVLIADECL